MLAGINSVRDDCTFTRFPGCIGNNRFFSSIRVREMKLSNQSRRTVWHCPTNRSIIKTISQYTPQSIITRLQQVLQIITKIKHIISFKIILQRNTGHIQIASLSIIRLIRNQYIITHFFPVQVKFKISQPGNINFCSLNFFRHRKIFSQHWSREHCFVFRFGSRYISLPRCTNPLCFPIIRIQKSHIPIGRFTPFRHFSFFIPHTDLPPTFLPGFQLFSRIRYQIGCITLYFPTVPQIRFSFL